MRRDSSLLCLLNSIKCDVISFKNSDDNRPFNRRDILLKNLKKTNNLCFLNELLNLLNQLPHEQTPLILLEVTFLMHAG